jgi:GH25 family lysozyme M1 (1,4-beta-N-acetylmuramidase)
MMVEHTRVTRLRLGIVMGLLAAVLTMVTSAPANVVASVPRLKGLDVSSWQGNVDWASVKANGAKFAYVKATEGTGYTNPYFAQQYNGSYNVGLIRGAYHFALPNVSSATTQADYFVSNGGGWSRDGKTLPPMLDIEYNPYGATCYGYSQSGMASWIQAFSDEVHARTIRYPTIYSTLDWWTTCTGNYGGLGATNPLFIARYSTSPGTLPAGWSFWTFRQFSNSGTFPGDQDYFNGAYKRLVALANG